MATSIKLPQAREELFRHQWFDYRHRITEQIQRLAELLHGSDVRRGKYGLTVVPEGLQKVVVPPVINFVVNGARSLGSFTISAGLYLLLMLLPGKGGSGSGLVLIVLGVAFIWLANRLSARRFLFAPFLALFGAAWLLALLFNLGGVWWTVFRNYGADPYSSYPSTLGGISLTLILALPSGLALANLALIRRWLPLPARRDFQGAPMQLSAARDTWFIYGLGIVYLVLVLLNFTQL